MLLMSAQIAYVPPKSKTHKKHGGSLDRIQKAFMPIHRKYQGLFCATNIIVCQDTTLKLDFVSLNTQVT